MDQAIIWAVVWGLLAFLSSGIVAWAVIAVVGVMGIAIDQDWLAIVGFVLGWLAGIGWFIFCVVHSVESIITAVNLA